MTAHLPQPLRRLAEEALLLASTLAEAEEIQWKPSVAPKPREDTTERAKGGHGDPTLSIVVDDRRLAVRDAVVKGSEAIEATALHLAGLRERLEAEIDAWNGN